jgi:hypothetical protein
MGMYIFSNYNAYQQPLSTNGQAVHGLLIIIIVLYCFAGAHLF